MQPLGQHFLKNKNAAEKIVSALDLKNGETAIEIGPGEGALTLPLINECEKIGCKLIAIEKDRNLGVSVQGLGDSDKLKVVIGDVLEILPEITKPYTLSPIPYKIIGNI